MIPPLLFRELSLLEPHRMELARALAAEASGTLTFVELRRRSGLTDGNLNRHLHRMEQDGLVESAREKAPGRRPKTMIRLTRAGRNRLRALAGALRDAAREIESARPGVRIVRVARKAAGPERSDATVVAPTAVEAAPEAGSLVSEAFLGPD